MITEDALREINTRLRWTERVIEDDLEEIAESDMMKCHPWQETYTTRLEIALDQISHIESLLDGLEKVSSMPQEKIVDNN